MSTNLRLYFGIVAGLLSAGLAFACSSDPAPAEPDPGPDAGQDSGNDAKADVAVDAGCADCAWYPANCTKGSFCAVDVDIDPRTVLLALGARDQSMIAVGSYGTFIDHSAGAWRPGTVGTRDALKAVTIHGNELWAASSLDAIFVRPLQGGTEWTHRTIKGEIYYTQVAPTNGLYGSASGEWVWAAVTPICAGGIFGNGTRLVRVKKGDTQLEAQELLKNDPYASSCAGLFAIDGKDDMAWAVGDLGAVFKLSNLQAEKPTIAAENSNTTTTLLSVWAEPSGHLWAAGKMGTLVHRAPGEAFTVVELPTEAALHAIRGTSPSDIWIVGEGAVVLHFDGKTWSRVPVAGLGDQRPTLRAIAAVAPDRVWIAGDGVLLELSTTEKAP